MKLKQLFWVQVVLSTINGLGPLLMPTTWLGMYGIPDVTAATAATAQALGAGLLNYAIVAFFARNAPPSATRKAIAIGFCITHAIGGVVLALATIKGVMSPMGWFGAFLYLIMALGYAYFLLIKKEGLQRTVTG